MLSAGHVDARAGAATNEFPGVALEIDRRRPLAGRAGTGSAVILALEGNAVALLLVSRRGGCAFFLGQWRGIRHRRHGGSDRAGQKGRTYNGLHGHTVSPNRFAGRTLTGHDCDTSLERQVLQAVRSRSGHPGTQTPELRSREAVAVAP